MVHSLWASTTISFGPSKFYNYIELMPVDYSYAIQRHLWTFTLAPWKTCLSVSLCRLAKSELDLALALCSHTVQSLILIKLLCSLYICLQMPPKPCRLSVTSQGLTRDVWPLMLVLRRRVFTGAGGGGGGARRRAARRRGEETTARRRGW